MVTKKNVCWGFEDAPEWIIVGAADTSEGGEILGS
jgi:hypothetical protein